MNRFVVAVILAVIVARDVFAGSETDCHVPHCSPGCDDQSCSAAVCAYDPFCCEFGWDQICVFEAAYFCNGQVCQNPTHSCGEAGSAGCWETNCCNYVCSIEPYCCEWEWDQWCAQVGYFCGKLGVSGPPFPESATCCAPWPGTGCNDCQCQSAVCAIDPFCCESQWDASCAELAMSLCAAYCPQPIGCELQILATPNKGPQQYDSFGCDVALDGQTAMVGAYLDSPDGILSGGVVYVYTQAGHTWTETAALWPDDVTENDGFGTRIALQGDRALIASPYVDHSGFSGAGVAYIFERIDGRWIQQAKLIASDPGQYEHFGTAVALRGDFAFVGCQNDSSGPLYTHRGAVHVFERSGDAWIETAKLIPFDGAAFDAFGTSVAVDEDLLLVGSPNDSWGEWSGAGSIYVYELQDGAWTFATKITAADANSNQAFGYRVLVQDQTAVSCSLGDDHALFAGGVYVFSRVNGSWIQRQKLLPPGSPTATFGHELALHGDTLAAGSFEDSAIGETVGSVYIFQATNGQFVQTGKLTASDATSYAHYGTSIAIEDDVVLIGATRYPNFDGPSINGQAYLYSLGDLCQPILGDITGNGIVDVDDLLVVINSWGPCENPDDCPADVAPAPKGNGFVDVDDLLTVINNWG